MNKNYKNVVDIELEAFRRPVIAMEGTTVLIDTGATIPMFYFPVKLLEKAFGGATLVFDDNTLESYRQMDTDDYSNEPLSINSIKKSIDDDWER